MTRGPRELWRFSPFGGYGKTGGLSRMRFCGPFGKRGRTVHLKELSLFTEEVENLVLLRMAKWVLARSEFSILRVEGILHNWRRLC